MKGKVAGQSRATKVREAEDQGGKSPRSLRLGGQRPSGPGAKSQECQECPKPLRERDRERERGGGAGGEREGGISPLF